MILLRENIDKNQTSTHGLHVTAKLQVSEAIWHLPGFVATYPGDFLGGSRLRHFALNAKILNELFMNDFYNQ